jgi:sterol 14alpha-demethylase
LQPWHEEKLVQPKYKVRDQARTAKLPPLLPGVPLLGNLLDYRSDHLEVFWKGYKRFGPVFSLRLGPQRAVVMIGREYNRFFFTQADRLLSLPEVYRFVVPMFGRVLNASDDITVRRGQLALLHSAFHWSRMPGHIAAMVRETTEWLDQLGPSGTFDLSETLSDLAMKIAARSLMGHEVRNQLEEFLPLYMDLAKGMEFVLPPNLPLPRFIRRDRARRRLQDMIRPIIDARLAQRGRCDDFLQTIIDSVAGNLSSDSHETIVGLALITVFTAYITTAAQTAWTLLQLLQNPTYLALVAEERERILGSSGESLDMDALNRLTYLDCALKESQRMHPVMTHYARYNAHTYELDGYQIPRGWLTFVCPAVSHRLPEVFPAPDTYDPLRFLPDRWHDGQHTYDLIGFGAGVYRCPGATFGANEMKCILTLLFQRYKLELLDRDPQRDFAMGVIRPRPPCRIGYTLRKCPALHGANHNYIFGGQLS